jgi:hypothetical protein
MLPGAICRIAYLFATGYQHDSRMHGSSLRLEVNKPVLVREEFRAARVQRPRSSAVNLVDDGLG